MGGERTVSKSTVGRNFSELPANSTSMDSRKATDAHDSGRIAVARIVTSVL
jgi:hypothetical protein